MRHEPPEVVDIYEVLVKETTTRRLHVTAPTAADAAVIMTNRLREDGLEPLDVVGQVINGITINRLEIREERHEH